ncbi:MAG: nucleotidyltransferase family protein, partial [Bacteroidales bacterium]|nr:nucleotidyltransferase family protein [Bacteroidales bacterium]
SALLRPNATFNALFLAKHALRHFIDEAICLRHIMDWALFLKAEAANVDWQLLRPHLEASRVLPFAQLLTHISLRHLGLPASTPLPDWLRSDGDERLARWEEMLLADTFGGHPSMAGETFFMKCKRILRRFRRIYRFRDLADETPATLIWNAFAFSSYLHRKL